MTAAASALKLRPRGQASPSSAAETVLGTLPFLLFGLTCLADKLSAVIPWLWLSYLVFFPLPLIGLAIGLIRGVPRWTWACLGWAAVYAGWWMGMPANSLGALGLNGNGSALLGWRAWVLLLAALLFALAWTRSLRPAWALVERAWDDWSLVSLGMYALPAWLLSIYDENHSPHLLAFMAASTAALCGGAWLYFQGRTPAARLAALAAGLLLALALSWACSLTWDPWAYYGRAAPPPLTAWEIAAVLVLWSALLGWPALLGLARQIVEAVLAR